MLAILLATYNGERFLNQQLDSLLNQTYQDWVLYVHDDGSTDGTVNILKEYQCRYSNIFVLEDEQKNRGAAESFMWLLEQIEAEYYMFCDQDDVWLPQKIEKSIDRMLEIEVKNKELPVAVYTDLFVVDSELKMLHASLWEMCKVYPRILSESYKYLSVWNFATGCTMIINHRVKDICLPYPVQTVMHDYWIALRVALVGKIDYIETPTILYRQHENNSIGAEEYPKNPLLGKLRSLFYTIRLNHRQYKLISKAVNLSYVDYWFYKWKYLFLRLNHG